MRGELRAKKNTVVAVFAQKQGFLPCFLKGDEMVFTPDNR